MKEQNKCLKIIKNHKKENEFYRKPEINLKLWYMRPKTNYKMSNLLDTQKRAKESTYKN